MNVFGALNVSVEEIWSTKLDMVFGCVQILSLSWTCLVIDFDAVVLSISSTLTLS